MNESLQKPILLIPVYRSSIWGGSRIAKCYHRTGTPEACSESWEISAHPEGCGIIADGEYRGRRLDDLTKEFGTDLVGTHSPDPHTFPLLFKIIDARENLSVQIHPNNKNACLTDGYPKTEMWYVLDRTPGASLYAGLTAGTTEYDLRDALANGTMASRVVNLPVEPNEALYIPGGLVHAIGAGCLIYEIQQSSNTTYRFFDWNRVGADGKPRKLHLEESIKTIDWSLPAPTMREPVLVEEKDGNLFYDVLSSPYFHLRRLDITSPCTVTADGSTFHVFFVKGGTATLSAGGATVHLAAGGSALLPASATSYTLSPDKGDAEILITTL